MDGDAVRQHLLAHEWWARGYHLGVLCFMDVHFCFGGISCGAGLNGAYIGWTISLV
jgi:hypothetical protein